MELVSLDDYEKKAREKLSNAALDYYRSGAGNEYSLSLNRSSFDKLRIRPRVLRDVANRDLSCEIYNEKFSFPLGISPTAMQKMAHPDGENANARAAGTHKIPFILSTIATSSIEEVAKSAPDTIKWFQLYIYKDRELTKQLVDRAQAAGFKALVLTVDAPIFGLRRADVRNKFSLPQHLSMANFSGLKATGVKSGGGSGINEYVAKMFDQSLTWKDLKWLINYSKLPVLVKGVLCKEDAELSVEMGAAGIIVSNHGARQVDGVPASIEVLPEIVDAVAGRVPVFLDGGIRQGTDIFKALAIGAKMVFIGRPAVFGLAVNGQKGVENIIEILKKEFDITLCLSGCRTVADITRDMVVHENIFAKL